MKIRINYDLIDKIRESKTGISLKRTRKEVLFYTLFWGIIDISAKGFDETSIKEILSWLIFSAASNSITFPLLDKYVFSFSYKNRALNDLKSLAQLLRENYISTNYELLQEAYKYESSYSIVLDEDKIPRVKQEKYIMVPVVDRDGEKEVLLVQEHLIGSKTYELSYGSPKKVLKPAVNFV